MAIYHLETQVIARSEGRSSIACAAYRSGELLVDERTGTVHQHGDPERVAHVEVVTPAGSPAWATDRAALWNRLEVHERRKDAQLAREWEVALPIELTLVQQRDLLRGWIAAELTPHGMIADVAIHLTKAGQPANPHAHVMAPLRPFDPIAGTWGNKFRDPDRYATLDGWRTSWADHVNAALERAGHEARVDHRSHADRGIEDEPTKKEGAAAHGRVARGLDSDRIAQNRAIRARNTKRRRLLEEVKERARANRPTKKVRTTGRVSAPAKAGLLAQAAKVQDAGATHENAKRARGPQPPMAADDAIDLALLAALANGKPGTGR